MEHEYGLIGGNIFHGELSADQMLEKGICYMAFAEDNLVAFAHNTKPFSQCSLQTNG